MANKKSGGNTVEIVTSLVMPLIEEQGLILWDVRFEKEGSMWILRIIIDKAEGIKVDDCENISRPFDKILDEADPIDQSYCLEVASAGLERELTKQWHFNQCAGQKVCARLIRPLDGERDFIGELQKMQDNIVTINLLDDDTVKVFETSLKDVAYVRLYIEF